MKLYTIKGMAIGATLALAVPALSATVTTLYLSGGTPGTAGHIAVFTSDGLGIQDGGAATQKFINTSWLAGMTLQNKAIPLAHFASASTAVGLVCRPEVVTGGTSGVDLYFVASGTACASGVKINTTACNGNGTALTDQAMGGIANAAITANSDICAVFSNDPAWTTTTGTGFVQVATTTP